jgi:hypothetical protein
MSADWWSSPEGPLLRLYDLLSGPAEHERPWDDVRELFLDDAHIRLSIPRPEGAEWRDPCCDWTVEGFLEAAEHEYRHAGFWECEIARRVERFGNIAHVWSTYESRVGSADSPPVARGINSVQLLRSDGRWHIAGIIFHVERPDDPLPGRYLE